MPRTVNVACLQTRPMSTMDAALDETLPFAKEAVAGGAQILFLPEYCGGLQTDGPAVRPPSAPEDSHAFLRAMQSFARDTKTHINLGSIAIDGPDGKVINRGLMLDAAGRITGRYDKINMFDIQLSANEVYRESAFVAPGNRARIHETDIARIGQTICYDLRFPQLFRTLAQAGAEILICPAAFTRKTGEAHWHVLNRARAIETTRFVISACATGDVPSVGPETGACYGHSLIINPWGEVIADGGPEPGVVQAEIDLDEVEQAASRIPSLMSEREFTLEKTPSSPRSVA